MARPTTKENLMIASEDMYKKMNDLIDTLTPEEMEANFFFDISAKKEAHWKRDKNIRDVIVHLYEWHRLFIEWTSANLKGENRPFLPEGFNWKTYGDMNVGFFNKHQKTTLSEAREMLKKSHKEVMSIIEKFTNEQLYTNAYYPWTGTNSLGAYCVSETSSHYEWAIKKIKLHVKAVKQTESGAGRMKAKCRS